MRCPEDGMGFCFYGGERSPQCLSVCLERGGRHEVEGRSQRTQPSCKAWRGGGGQSQDLDVYLRGMGSQCRVSISG